MLHTLLAITAAAARPPIRGCRMRMRLVLEIGKTASRPVSIGPAQLLASRIAAIKPQTRIVRNGKSYQACLSRGISAVRNVLPSHRQAAVSYTHLRAHETPE